jgi:hypothetical protein
VSAGVRIRGNASAEELAVVLALISQLDRVAEPDRYTEWRDGRLAALRARPAGYGVGYPRSGRPKFNSRSSLRSNGNDSPTTL